MQEMGKSGRDGYLATAISYRGKEGDTPTRKSGSCVTWVDLLARSSSTTMIQFLEELNTTKSYYKSAHLSYIYITECSRSQRIRAACCQYLSSSD